MERALICSIALPPKAIESRCGDAALLIFLDINESLYTVPARKNAVSSRRVNIIYMFI